jgi:hypothetical protein
MAMRLEWITMSGLPGSVVEQVRKRNPAAQSAFRKSSSGVVSRDRTRRMMAEISFG